MIPCISSTSYGRLKRTPFFLRWFGYPKYRRKINNKHWMYIEKDLIE